MIGDGCGVECRRDQDLAKLTKLADSQTNTSDQPLLIIANRAEFQPSSDNSRYIFCRQYRTKEVNRNSPHFNRLRPSGVVVVKRLPRAPRHTRL